MSRSYLVYGELEKLHKDTVYKFLCEWCGQDQIFKIQEVGDEIYFFCEMGCSSGVQPEDSLECLKDQLEDIGAREVHLSVWSMHQDDAIYHTRDNEHEDED